jgi:hypothetical protein
MLCGAHYDDEAGDSVALDYVRDTLLPTAAKTGAPTVVLGGKFTAALLLDAAEYVEYFGQEFLNALAAAGTIEFWVKPGYSGSPGLQQTFVYIVKDGGLIDRASIWHTASGFLQLYINGSAGTVIASISQAWAPTAGIWYHMAASWADAKARLYVGGAEIDAVSMTGARAGSANYMAVGYDKSSSVAQDYLLDELAVFDEAQYEVPFTPPTAPYDMTPATLDNPSFEVAATQGGVDVVVLPASWDIDAAAVKFSPATFGPPNYWAESFDALWMGNEDTIDEFAPGDLDAAVFGADPVTVYDSFETQWMGNEDALFDFTQDDLTAAEFSSSAVEYEAFDTEWPARHPVADSRWITATAVSQVPAEVHARLNLIKAQYNPHVGDATVHTAADSANTITSADASDLATAITLATELWTDCWTHMLDVALDYHLADTGQAMKKPTLAAAVYPPTDYVGLQAVALLLTIYVDLHFTWLDNAGPGLYEEFDPTLTNIFAYPLAGGFEGGITKENFEQKWMDNETAISEFDPGDLYAAEFLTDVGTEKFESFEQEIALEVILGAASEGAPQDIEDSLRVRVTITGTFVASVIVRARREGSTSWIDIDTAYGPGDVDVPVGYAAIRMYTDAYTSGTPVAKWKWGPMLTR